MTQAENQFNKIKPRYEKAFLAYNGEGSQVHLSYAKGFVVLTTKTATGSGTSYHRVAEIEKMCETLEQRLANNEYANHPKQPIKPLEDGGYYWVYFSANGKMEIAEYCMETNRLKFTNGSRCEPERVSFIDRKRLMY